MPHNCHLHHLQWKQIVKQHYRCHKGTCIISFPSFFPGFRGDSTTNRPLRLPVTQQTARNAHEFVSQLFTIIFCCLEGTSFSWGKYFHHWTTVHKQEGCVRREPHDSTRIRHTLRHKTWLTDSVMTFFLKRRLCMTKPKGCTALAQISLN